MDKRFTALSAKARYFYIVAAHEAGGKRDFKLTLSKMDAFGIKPRAAQRYIRELERAGFIEIVRTSRDLSVPNEYRFCFRWLEEPGTR